MAKVMSPPAPAPACARPEWPPSWGATSSRSAAASSSAIFRGAPGVATRSSGSARAGGPLAQLHVEVLSLAVPDDLERNRVARARAGDQPGQIGLRHDLVPVDGHDHVAARLHLLALEADLLVGAAQPCLVCGSAREHPGHQRPGLRGDAEAIGELWIERLTGDADVGVLDRPVL